MADSTAVTSWIGNLHTVKGCTVSVGLGNCPIYCTPLMTMYVWALGCTTSDPTTVYGVKVNNSTNNDIYCLCFLWLVCWSVSFWFCRTEFFSLRKYQKGSWKGWCSELVLVCVCVCVCA